MDRPFTEFHRLPDTVEVAFELIIIGGASSFTMLYAEHASWLAGGSEMHMETTQRKSWAKGCSSNIVIFTHGY